MGVEVLHSDIVHLLRRALRNQLSRAIPVVALRTFRLIGPELQLLVDRLAHDGQHLNVSSVRLGWNLRQTSALSDLGGVPRSPRPL